MAKKLSALGDVSVEPIAKVPPPPPSQEDWDLVVHMITQQIRTHMGSAWAYRPEAPPVQNLVLGSEWAPFMPDGGLRIAYAQSFAGAPNEQHSLKRTVAVSLSHVEGQRLVQVCGLDPLIEDPFPITAEDVAAARRVMHAVERLKQLNMWPQAVIMRFHPDHAGHRLRSTTPMDGGGVSLLCSCGWTLRVSDTLLVQGGFGAPMQPKAARR